MTLFLKRFSKVIAWVLVGFIALFALYAALGFWWAPGWVQSKAEQFVEEKLDRQLSIEKMEINPLTFSVNMRGVKLTEPKSDEIFASFDELAMDVSVRSVLRAAPVVKNIQLTNPYVHVVRTKDNHYNFDDLLALAKESKADSQRDKDADKEAAKEPARYAIHNIKLENGRIVFDDVPKKKKHTVDELMLGIPFISSMPSDIETTVDLLLSATIDGTPAALSAEMKPFSPDREMTAKLQLKRVDLPSYMQYLPFKPRFKLPQAKLNTDLVIHFIQPEKKTPELLISGQFRLDSVLLTELNNTPLVRLKSMDVTLEKSPILTDHYQIAKISLTQPEIFATRTRNGQWNLANLGSGESSKEQKSKIQLVLKQLAVQNGKLTYKDASLPYLLSTMVEKWNLTVDNTAVDMGKNEVNIGQVSSSSATVHIVSRKRTRKGERPNRTRGRSGASQSDARGSQEARPAVQAKAPAAQSVSKSASTPAWVVNLDKLAVSGWSIRHENHIAKTITTDITGLALNMSDLSTVPGKQSNVTLKGAINKTGHVSVDGQFALSPYRANLSLDLKNVDVRATQSYIDEYVNLVVQRAYLSAKGVLVIAEDKKQGMQGNYKGTLSIDNLVTVDQLTGARFIGWKRLFMQGVHTELSPLSVSIKQVSLQDLQARIIISPEGRINLQDILRSEAGGQKSLTEENPEKSVPAAGEAPAASKTATQPRTQSTVVPAKNEPVNKPRAQVPIQVDKFRMRNGRIRFTDNYIKPNYTANLLNLSGSVLGLSSKSEGNAQVDIRGEVYGAPLTIAGTITPFRENLFLDLQAHVKGMDLTQLSAYSIKYAGYGIEKGKLSFDVHYRLDNRVLTAENRLILDQLTLGERVDSATATKLPLHFALSLLKDSNGVIDVNLPIKGSLDDPEFSVGSIIFRMIAGMITKVVTAPFSFLASIAGQGGEGELSWMAFEAGRRVIPEKGEVQLTTMAKALTERPALKLEITGRYDPVGDKEGLAQASIQRKVRALKRSDLEAKGEKVAMNQVKVLDSEYPALLARVYKNEESGVDAATGLPKTASVPEMEKALMAFYKTSEDDLVFLGNQRAEAVRDWFVKEGKISQDRIFILGSKDGLGKEGVPASRVDFSLR